MSVTSPSADDHDPRAKPYRLISRRDSSHGENTSVEDVAWSASSCQRRRSSSGHELIARAAEANARTLDAF
jgi:hypothetical protein